MVYSVRAFSMFRRSTDVFDMFGSSVSACKRVLYLMAPLMRFSSSDKRDRDTGVVILRGSLLSVASRWRRKRRLEPPEIFETSGYALADDGPRGPQACSLEQLLQSLAKKEIQDVCVGLADKLDVLTQRTWALEVSVEELKETTSRDRQEADKLKVKYKVRLDRLESLENNVRRNNIRLTNVLKGKEGEDIKTLVVELLIQSGAWQGLEDMLLKDIQRVHQDPFR
ncbi:hypothetical protein NDU88_010881 [Pleurodeles waltl]|uniref:Uncharacterized protein n=1 Tax=Pleurodeles waltl TaxID=8319 RepID=A0AAV7R1I9_PLEWA|nr:hypothetical protein NDU88_010881 [Pleurodeles waltl]